MKVNGFSHVTINVRNLEKSLQFYKDVLKMELVHKGAKDAYLEWGTAWVCLIERKHEEKNGEEGEGGVIKPSPGVDHIAFHIDATYFDEAVNFLRENGVTITREPVKRGLGWTINFLDPDGTELELHTSTLQERMKVWT